MILVNRGGTGGGTSGAPGTSFRSGHGVPPSTLGINGDTYLDLDTDDVYGPKAAGVWGAPVDNIHGLVGATGPQGGTGTAGIPGAPGEAGHSLLSVHGAPAAGVGVDGDSALDLDTGDLYGPKAGGVWGPVQGNLHGAVGAAGATGATGAQGLPGTGIGLDWIEFAGHSLPAGGGSRIAPWGGYTWRTKGALGIKNAHDYAIGGAIACRPNAVATGDGGYPWVLRNVIRPGLTGSPSAAGAPYNPQSQAVIAHFALNDLGILGAAKPLPFQTALRTILARFCASSVWLYDAAALVYTGTWATIGMADASASSTDAKGLKYTNMVNDKVVFNLPADFPAGRVVDVTLWLNATWAPVTYGVKVDGVALPDLVLTPSDMTDQTVANQHILHTLRIGTGIAGDVYGAALAAGAHAVELTLKAGPTLAMDSCAVEADPLDGPLLICPLPNKPANYSIWATWPGGPSMNDAVVDQWKDYERAILAEFPTRVISDSHGLGIDLDDAALVKTTDGTGDFISDGAHPNERGHGKWVNLIASIVRASPLLTDRIRSRPFVDPRPRAWKQVGKVMGAGAYNTNWTPLASAGLYDLQWRVDEFRRVYVRGAARAAAGATTTLLVANTLPKAANLVSVQYNRFDGTTWTTGQVRSANTGVLALSAAAATAAGNFHEFNFDYQAEI